MRKEGKEGEVVWPLVYGRIKRFLEHFGPDSPFPGGHYFVVDEDTGPSTNTVETADVRYLRSEVVLGLRRLLDDVPSWQITIAFQATPDPLAGPIMGLTIRKHEIIDGLDRRYLPPEFANLHYPDSRPGTYED